MGRKVTRRRINSFVFSDGISTQVDVQADSHACALAVEHNVSTLAESILNCRSHEGSPAVL